jgi:uncharacterized protein with von Willebrand factor type A (vWA) domain
VCRVGGTVEIGSEINVSEAAIMLFVTVITDRKEVYDALYDLFTTGRDISDNI